MTNTEAPAPVVRMMCDDCGGTHDGEFSHIGTYCGTPIYSVICDDLTANPEQFQVFYNLHQAVGR